jgi:hypothetical protein
MNNENKNSYNFLFTKFFPQRSYIILRKNKIYTFKKLDKNQFSNKKYIEKKQCVLFGS